MIINFKTLMTTIGISVALIGGGATAVHADSTTISNVPQITAAKSATNSNNNGYAESTANKVIGYTHAEASKVQSNAGDAVAYTAAAGTVNSSNAIAGTGVQANAGGITSIDGFWKRLWSSFDYAGGNVLTTIIKLIVILCWIGMGFSLLMAVLSLFFKKLGSPWKWISSLMGAVVIFALITFFGSFGDVSNSIGAWVNYILTGH